MPLRLFHCSRFSITQECLVKNSASEDFYLGGLVCILRTPYFLNVWNVLASPGASIPLTPWSKFPLPFPLALEVGPLIAVRESGGAL